MSPSATKQMSWLSGLSATSSPRRAASSRTSRLRGVAEREHRVGELLAGQHAEHVGLVLGRVDRAVQLGTVGALHDLRVVAGGHGVEAERQRAVEHGGELDLLVAAQARVRGAAGGVLVHEVLDDVLVEPLGEVPDVERDADHVGGAAGVVGVLERAAAARARAVGRGVAREGEVDAGDVVAGLGGPGGGDGGVDAAGHRGEDAHCQPPAHAGDAARARRPAPIASTSGVDVGRGRGVAEREAQRVARALLVAPIASSTWEGCGDAGRAGRAGGALDAAGVEQHQQRVALAAGEAEVRVAGQPVRPGRGRRGGGRRAPPRAPGDQLVAQGGEPLARLGLPS